MARSFFARLNSSHDFQRLNLLFRFQIDTKLGAKPQTVLTHGKAKQQSVGLIWKRN